MKKQFALYSTVLGMCIILIGVGASCTNQEVHTTSEKLNVVASFYPLAHFAEQVGGSFISVNTITPLGVEPHDFEPTPQDIASINTAQVFLFQGAGLDPWAEQIQNDVAHAGVAVVEMTEKVPLLTASGEEHAHEGEEEDFEHAAGEYDPHTWLDPLTAVQEVEAIRDALKQADPEHAATYDANAQAYIVQLQQLHDAYQQGLDLCRFREIIVSHNAFQYLAKQYAITTIPIAGITPDQEPSPRAIAELSTLAKEKGIKYIFFETLASPKIAETIATEINAQTLVLNPIEGLTPEEVQSGKTYISVMQDNLQNLRTAMECK
ncbi:MAG TPA: zinc ABC transporter substrate-binding protein [Patescibacteria group bacterium]|nr:zinc ABC transporter substrate-binding protein [Patescibacteria group bacterium]